VTPAQIRQVARDEARRVLSSAPSGGVPAVWTNEVQVYNDCLARQGVRTLRGLADIVCKLQTGNEGDCDGGPRGSERAFEFEGGRLVAIQHGSDLGADDAVIVRRTTLRYDDRGRLESVNDIWDHEGRPWGRSVVLSYDDCGQVALVMRGEPGPLVSPKEEASCTSKRATFP